MSNSNDNEERSPRFTKALMGRILAVGMFVVLGTFAVVHSMMGKNKLEGDAIAAVDPAAATQPNADGTQPLAKINHSSTATTKPGALNTSFANKPFTPPAVKPMASNSFGTSARAGNTSSFSVKPVVTTGKPASKPPQRFAQLPGSSKPPIGSSNGFAARPATPKVNPALSKTFGGFGNQATATANSIKNQAADAVTKTTNQAKTTINQAGQSLRNNVSQFGSPITARQTTKPTANPTQGTSRTTAPPALRGNPTTNNESPLAAFDTSRDLKPSSANNRNVGNNNRASSNSSPFDNIPVRNDLTRRSTASQNRSATGNLRPAAAPNNSRPGVSSRSVTSKGQSGFSSNPSTGRSTSSSAARPATTNNSQRRVDVAMLTANIPGDRELDGIQAPALTVEKVSPREIQVNRTADFEIVVRNVGRVTADDVKVFDQIPAGTEYVASVPEANRGGSNLEWQIGMMRPGQEKRIKLQLKPVTPGEIGSIARVTFATQASMRTLVTKPVLEIRHSTPTTVLIGDNVVLDVVVENKGDGPATNVIVQEDVPNQLEFNEGYRELEYEIGTLMPGQSKRVQLGLKAANVGRLKNIMFASADGGLRARHELDMEVVAPKLVTTAVGPTKRFLQRKVSHTFSVENTGTAKATNVELVARLPSGLRYINANNQGRYDANSHAVYWSLAELQPSIKAGVEVESMPIEVGSQDIKFEAAADLNQRSEARQALAVEHLVDIFFDIDDVVDPIEIGSDTSHRIRVVNQGTKTATNVQLQVEYPNGLRPTSIDGNLRNEIRGQTVVFSPINSMAPGDEISVVVNSQGTAAGDHRVVLNMQADGRQTPVAKQETTRVYADR